MLTVGKHPAVECPISSVSVRSIRCAQDENLFIVFE
jgi:hypothetical protein